MDPEIIHSIELSEATRKDWILSVLASLSAAVLSLALWLGASWWTRFPLAIYPLSIGALVAFSVHMTCPITGKGPASYAAVLSGVFSLIGTTISPIMVARPDHPTPENFQNMMAYLRSPGRFANVIGESLTPTDLIIVLATALGSHYLVMLLAKHSSRFLPVGESVDSIPSRVRDISRESDIPS